MEGLRIAREKCKMSQKELAEKIGVAPSTITNYEAGVREPSSLSMLCAIADALDCSLDMLVRGKEIDRPFGRSIEELVQMFRGLSDEQLDYFTAVMQAVKADRRFQAHLRQEGEEGQ